MSMIKTILDTDTLSAIMRQHPCCTNQAKIYLGEFPKLSISIITKYEILRGLMAKNATAQIGRFNVLCSSLLALPLTDGIIVRAAEIYGQLKQNGQITGDADILIAATCFVEGYAIATNNTSHFSRINGLEVQNWHLVTGS